MTSSSEFNNSHLSAARRVKQDEFYTQWETIEREANAYREFDPDLFRDQVVLCPCDDPEWSNFAKFFALHFASFGLKKLVSTSYAPDSNPAGTFYMPTVFEMEDPNFDETKTRVNGKKFVLERKDLNADGVINIDDLQWEYLEGDGDFRSAEVTALRDEADFIFTNPPFSLFRAFIGWLIEGEKRFSVIGSDAAVTTKDLFALIKANTLWKGATGNNSDMVFGVPKGVAVKKGDADKAKRLGYPPNEKFDFTRLGNSCWYTNIDHGRRHQPMQLMTKADNIRFSRHKVVKGIGYRSMDNYDAIDVPKTEAIPSDHDALMGVPISFLDRYNPEQFEIISLTQTWSDQSTKTYPGQILVKPDGTRKRVGALNSGPAFRVDAPPDGESYYDIDGEFYVSSFKRVLIKRRDAK